MLSQEIFKSIWATWFVLNDCEFSRKNFTLKGPEDKFRPIGRNLLSSSEPFENGLAVTQSHIL
ncbi:hypothetical protein CH367_08205 [Leptospira barantonii]|uniref:Uncharacterized protein n=1 Tax=Leptospira barantonii TaxID=2023184 RepID=A0ABX4NRH7_9LEPT|nr:hypothetical protein CH367_08205 [Leptospira barantonii]